MPECSVILYWQSPLIPYWTNCHSVVGWLCRSKCSGEIGFEKHSSEPSSLFHLERTPGTPLLADYAPLHLLVHYVCIVVHGNSIVDSVSCSSRSLQVDMMRVFGEIMKEGVRLSGTVPSSRIGFSSVCDSKVQWGEGDANYGACRPSLLRAPSLFLYMPGRRTEYVE